MSYRVTVLPGDGIGPEVVKAMRACVDATGVKVDWEEVEVGAPHQEVRTPLPRTAIDSIRKNKVAIKGPLNAHRQGVPFGQCRAAQELDLFACLRPSKSIEGTRTVTTNVDLVIVRENTEDLYAGIEFDVHSDQAKHLIKEINALSTKRCARTLPFPSSPFPFLVPNASSVLRSSMP